MSIFKNFSARLNGPVGNGLKNRPEDVKSTKQNLSRLGYFADDTENDYIIPATSFDPIGDRADASLDKLQLPQETARQLLDERLRSDANRLRRVFPDFDNFEPEAPQALLDMQYNLGSTKFRETRTDPKSGMNIGWPSLFKAVKQQDWEKAAQFPHRNDVGKERNETTHSLFMTAWARNKPKK